MGRARCRRRSPWKLRAAKTRKSVGRVALRSEAEMLLPEPITGFIDLRGERCDDSTPWRARVAENVFLRTLHLLARWFWRR
jgi:hypothetical protein